jgi:HNH endonuclease
LGVIEGHPFIMSKQPIHPSIKESLGYEVGVSDKDFLKDWRHRATRVCKPCWELKYCPYGPFVEQSPLLPVLRAESQRHHDYLVNCLKTDQLGEFGPLSEEKRAIFESLLDLSVTDPDSFARHVKRSKLDSKTFEDALKEAESMEALLSSEELPPIHLYKPPFPFDADDAEKKMRVTPELGRAIKVEISAIKGILATNFLDSRRPLDEKRRRSFQAQVDAFDAEALPESIPDVVSDMACNIFGHICPVVFVGEDISETSDKRRRGRYIPFTVKMRVVRRDNYTCQDCGCHLRDDEVEFDHIIPHAKGGSSEEQNIRLTCYDCNRDKSDTVEI